MHPDMQAFGDEFQKIAADDVKRRGLGWRVPLAAGGAAAAGAIPAGLAYMLMRRFRPAVEPGLRALQEAAGGRPLAIAHEMTPERAALWSRGWGEYGRDVLRTALKDRGNLGKTVKSLPMGRNLISVPRRGTSELTPEALAETAKQMKGKVVVPRYPGAVMDAEGAINLNQGVTKRIMDDKWRLYQALAGKPIEGELGQTAEGALLGGGQGVKHLLPDTKLLSEALESVGGDPEKLKTLFESSGYVIKPRWGSMGRLEKFVQDITPVGKPQFQEVLKTPEKFIIQEKLPAGFKEFRVHTLADKPVTATHRWLPENLQSVWEGLSGSKGGGAFFPVMNPLTRRGLKDTAREASKRLQPEGGRMAAGLPETHYAWDIAKLPKGGGYRIIEPNAYPGTLRSPLVVNKLESALAGKTPRFVAAPAAAGLGLAGAGAAAGAAVPLSLIGSKQKGTK
jgi:hypothetical protein